MGLYKFEMVASVSDIVSIYADSYDEAMNLANEEADIWYAVSPAGYSVSWDHVELICIEEPDEEDA